MPRTAAPGPPEPLGAPYPGPLLLQKPDPPTATGEPAGGGVGGEGASGVLAAVGVTAGDDAVAAAAAWSGAVVAQ